VEHGAGMAFVHGLCWGQLRRVCGENKHSYRGLQAGSCLIAREDDCIHMKALSGLGWERRFSIGTEVEGY